MVIAVLLAVIVIQCIIVWELYERLEYVMRRKPLFVYVNTRRSEDEEKAPDCSGASEMPAFEDRQ